MALALGDVLSLEHIIGYTGRFPNTLRLHPGFETGIAYSLGPTVVLGDVTDPHEQIFLRRHESPVSALDVSPSGALLVSGQLHEPAVSSFIECAWRSRGSPASYCRCFLHSKAPLTLLVFIMAAGSAI